MYRIRERERERKRSMKGTVSQNVSWRKSLEVTPSLDSRAAAVLQLAIALRNSARWRRVLDSASSAL